MLKSLPATLKRIGLTQGEMAAEIGVAEETVSRWVNGHATPGGENLLATLSCLQKRDPAITIADITEVA